MCADHILDLACTVLGVETIMVSLLDGEKKFVKCGTGLVKGGGISLDPPAICHWSLVPTLHQMVIVEDTHQDARRGRVPVQSCLCMYKVHRLLAPKGPIQTAPCCTRGFQDFPGLHSAGHDPIRPEAPMKDLLDTSENLSSV